MIQIKAKVGKEADAPSATANYDMPVTLADKVKLWTDNVVNSIVQAAVVIDIQAVMRRLITAKKTPAEIQAAVSAYRPGVRGSSAQVDVDALFLANFDNLSKEAQLKKIEEMKKKAGIK